MARWDSGPESETAKRSGEGDPARNTGEPEPGVSGASMTGPEFEVEVKPRRGPGGSDIYDAPKGGKAGPEDG